MSPIDTNLEIERRFLVRPNMDFIRTLPLRHIQQVYLHTGPHPEQIHRVRIVNGESAEMTQKDGTLGEVRREAPAVPFDLKTAFALYKDASYRVAKTRYRLGRWEIDVFQDRHAPLVLAEYEKRHKDEEIPPFPPEAGVIERDVTDEISNYMLACVGTPMLSRSSKRIVFTGGPCSGKSTTMTFLEEHYKTSVHCVREVASIVMQLARILPYGARNGEQKSRNFQRTVATVQRAFEDGADFDAASEGRTVAIMDRGIADGAAYVPGGMHELESIIGLSRHDMYARYDMVLYFEMPSEEVFEKHSKNNENRYEKNYAEACRRGDLVANAWSGHPRFVIIKDTATWDEKLESAMSHLRPLLTP